MSRKRWRAPRERAKREGPTPLPLLVSAPRRKHACASIDSVESHGGTDVYLARRWKRGVDHRASTTRLATTAKRHAACSRSSADPFADPAPAASRRGATPTPTARRRAKSASAKGAGVGSCSATEREFARTPASSVTHEWSLATRARGARRPRRRPRVSSAMLISSSGRARNASLSGPRERIDR